jgi:hypothetical protein
VDYINSDQKTKDEIIQRMLDRQEITDILMRYSRGVDRIDIETLASCYWPDAMEDHGIYVGSIADFLKFIPTWENNQDTTHVMGTIIIDFDSPTVARTETYVRSFYNMPNGEHEMPRSDLPEGGRQELEVGGRYLDRFEKRGPEWRIAHRTLAVDWNRLTPASSVWDTPMYRKVKHRGLKYPQDPLYQILLKDRLAR